MAVVSGRQSKRSGEEDHFIRASFSEKAVVSCRAHFTANAVEAGLQLFLIFEDGVQLVDQEGESAHVDQKSIGRQVMVTARGLVVTGKRIRLDVPVVKKLVQGVRMKRRSRQVCKGHGEGKEGRISFFNLGRVRVEDSTKTDGSFTTRRGIVPFRVKMLRSVPGQRELTARQSGCRRRVRRSGGRACGRSGRYRCLFEAAGGSGASVREGRGRSVSPACFRTNDRKFGFRRRILRKKAE